MFTFANYENNVSNKFWDIQNVILDLRIFSVYGHGAWIPKGGKNLSKFVCCSCWNICTLLLQNQSVNFNYWYKTFFGLFVCGLTAHSRILSLPLPANGCKFWPIYSTLMTIKQLKVLLKRAIPTVIRANRLQWSSPRTDTHTCYFFVTSRDASTNEIIVDWLIDSIHVTRHLWVPW